MDFKELVAYMITSLINPVITLIFGAAVVFFLWNVLQLIRKSDQAEEREQFKSRITWGIIAIAVMASMWGLVNFVIDSFKPNSTPASVNTQGYDPTGAWHGDPFGEQSSKSNQKSGTQGYNTSGAWTGDPFGSGSAQ